MTQLNIRDAKAEDSGQIYQFIRELARYEEAEDQVVAREEDIRASIFGQNSTVKALICEWQGVAIGFAVYFFNYSTWQGRNGLYLEDLYVSPQQRGSGAGKALLKHLAKIAVAKNCGRFEWAVLDWNQPAIDFYHAIGAQHKKQWLGYQLVGDRLAAFAAS